MPKKAKPKPTPKAKKPNQNNNQRANLPSEVAKQYAQPARTRPATPITSAAKVSPGPAKAKVVKTSSQSISAAENTQIDTAFAAKRTPKIKTTMGTETTGYGVNNSILGATGTNMMASLNSTNPLKVSPTSTQAKSVAAGAAYKNQPKTPTTKASAPSVATAPEARINLSKDNKTVAATPKYDQEYWAGKRASGVSQADMKAEQDSIGMSKAYSGDKVVTADMKRKASDDLSRVTGSMATIENGGVTKTESEKYGLLNERQDTTYNYKGGPSIVTKANDPSLFGLNFGDKTSTTYVDGTEVATKTGRDPLGKDAKVTRPEGLAKDINDTQDIDPVKAADEITDIDNQIKAETDPVKLKALYQRRLRLIRMSRTNTKFAGLLGEADTKKSILTSIM
jgi:hypothetical protein